MEFLFNLFNHSAVGQRSLEDIIGIIGHQMRALGHQVIWDPRNSQFLPAERGYNVVAEGFTPYSVQVLADAHAAGARFIFLVTEEPTAKGFNHGLQAEMVARQAIFPEAVKFADAILSLFPGGDANAWYSQFAPTAYAELGFAPSLVRHNSHNPTYDFGFFGSLSPRRIAMIKKISRKCPNPKAVKVISDFPSQADRDAAMRDVKVVLQLRKFEEMGTGSSSRCNTSLCIGRPVVAEPHAQSGPWGDVVHFAKTDAAFVGDALSIAGMWRGIHAGQFRRFKEAFPPEYCIGRPLREMGVTP